MTENKNAIISVSNKDNLDILIPYLEQENYNIYSTGSTMTNILELVSNKEIVFSIASYTESPEICDGRVKTLHPRIFGGILGNRDNQLHIDDLDYINANFFDLVVVNLYPFEKVFEKYEKQELQKKELIQIADNLDEFQDFQNSENFDISNNFLYIKLEENNDEITEEYLLENIDIGGHSLLRAASKNYKYINVLSDPAQYSDFINGNTNPRQLAKEAFKVIMNYDIAINNWLNDDNQTVGVSYNKQFPIKYGLNPYMTPSSLYTRNNKQLPFKVLNGNPGYINLLDVHYAIHLVLEAKKQLNKDCCASFKHNSPAGVSTVDKLSMKEYVFYNSHKLGLSTAASTFLSSRNIDPISSFGDIIGYSGVVDIEMAYIIKKYVSDGIIAYDYTDEALDILEKKKQGNYLILKQQELYSGMEFRDINGITLAQPTNDSVLNIELLKELPENIQSDMILGYITLKYTQSNCVCFVYNNRVIGIGSGQQNRLDCIKIAGEKANAWMIKHDLHISREKNITLVSDAFLPFVDNIDLAAEYNVQYILQPGGSIRDKEITAECIKRNIDMVLTNQRIFTH